MAHKSFRRAQNLDKIEFDLPGPDGTDIHFDCEDDIPSGLIFAFIASSSDEDEASQPADEERPEGKVKKNDDLDTVLELFEAAIVDSQVEQFMGMVRATKKGEGIPVSMLMEIATWLGEQYSSRPTGLSSDSGPSVKPSGQASTGGALHAVTTYSKPEPVALTT